MRSGKVVRCSPKILPPPAICAAIALLLSACADSPLPLEQEPGPFVLSINTALSPRPGLQLPREVGYCNTLISSRKAPDGFRRGRVPIRTLSTFTASLGRQTSANAGERIFRFRRIGSAGNVMREAVCLLPDIPGVEGLALAQFDRGGAVVLQSCGQQDGGGGVVYQQGIDGGIQLQGDPNCIEHPISLDT